MNGYVEFKQHDRLTNLTMPVIHSKTYNQTLCSKAIISARFSPKTCITQSLPRIVLAAVVPKIIVGLAARGCATPVEC
jgi:hypothetical protein